MLYQEFIDQFEVYPSQKEARAKGYEAHHIIPKKVQKRNEIFDDRCVRLTRAQHAWAHVLYDLENGINSACLFLQELDLHKKNLEEITYEDLLPLNELAKVTIEKALEGTKAFYQDEEKASVHNKKVSEAKKGKSAWNKGIPHSPETKEKQSKAKKGKIHITNGIEEKIIPKNAPIPEGFVRGRKPSDALKNLIHITNGIEDRRIPKNAPIPEGFVRGRKSRKGN